MNDLKDLDEINEQMSERGNYRANKGSKIGNQRRSMAGKKQPFAAAKRSKKKQITLSNAHTK